MATVTEMRAWLREQGEDVPDRGRLRPELIELYEAGQAGIDGDPWPDNDDLEDVVAGEPAAPPAEPAPKMEPEVRPSRKRTRPQRAPVTGMLGRVLLGDSKTKTTPKGKPKPRVSLEKMTSRMYSMAGRIFAPLSPAAAKCMEIQGPMAGVVFEDVLKNTVVDRILQPVARVEGLIEVGEAFVLPPLACMAIEMTFAMEQTPSVVFRRTVAFQMLREGLRTGLEISEKYAEQIAAAREFAARSDAEVDRLCALIFPQAFVQAEDVPQPDDAMAAA